MRAVREEMGAEARQQPSERSWCLMELGQVNQILGEMPCPICQAEGTLKIRKDPNRRHGFSEALFIECEDCDYKSSSKFSSPKAKDSGTHEINFLMTVLTQELGLGYAALTKVEKVLGLQPMHLKTFQQHRETVADATIEMTQKNLKDAATYVHNVCADLGDAEGVKDVTVSFGTREGSLPIMVSARL